MPVLPKPEELAKGPRQALAEIRRSLNLTLQEAEAQFPALPRAEEALRRPKEVFKRVEEVLPKEAPKISEFVPGEGGKGSPEVHDLGVSETTVDRVKLTYE